MAVPDAVSTIDTERFARVASVGCTLRAGRAEFPASTRRKGYTNIVPRARRLRTAAGPRRMWYHHGKPFQMTLAKRQFQMPQQSKECWGFVRLEYVKAVAG